MFARSLTLAIAAFAISANAQCTRNATVAEGNTCDIISQENHVSTYQLALVNNGTVNPSCTNLQISQELCLGWNGMDCTETYMVQSGDSCDAISARYNLTQRQLYVNNPQVDVQMCNNIYVGEVLCVSQKTYAYPLLQLPSSSPNNVAPVPSAGTPSNIPTASATATPAPVPTSSESQADDEECDDSEEDTDETEYCADDDESPECVYEEDLPYCDEQ